MRNLTCTYLSQMPFSLGNHWFLDIIQMHGDEYLTLAYEDPTRDNRMLAGYDADLANVPEDVLARAAFWCTAKFRYARLSSQLDRARKQLYREYYLARHPALARYLEWQNERLS
jgi:hypothetical protein